MERHAEEKVARLLDELQRGDRTVVAELFSVAYDSLRGLAERERKRWDGDFTLNTTALVHEAYLKLSERSPGVWESKTHFLSVAAKAMRHVLVDYARRRSAEKRGGEIQKLSLSDQRLSFENEVLFSEERAEQLLELNEALKRLAAHDPRAVEVVECRFFGGMTIAETARVLGIAPRTVVRDWSVALAWLYHEMTRESRSSRDF